MTRHATVHPVWQQWHAPVPFGVHNRYGHVEMRAWPSGVSYSHGMDAAQHVHMQGVLPAAEAVQGQAAAAAGFGDYTDAGAGPYAAAGLANAGEDMRGAHEAWERICAELRGGEQASECEQQADDVVGVQSENGVLCAQDDGEVYEKGEVGENPLLHGIFYSTEQEENNPPTKWVVNPSDWIDVECQLRKLLRCESPECHAFHSIGYIFFRSCAVSHLERPGTFLRDGLKHRFPESGVVVEIVRAHPEGVLEVACYVEYLP
jgi:hypothetical protein